MTTNFSDLLKTVEEIREEYYPDLNPSLVEKILHIEAMYQDDRVVASKKLTEVIRNYIEKVS